MKKVHDEIIELIDRDNPRPNPIGGQAAWRGIVSYLTDPRQLQTWIESVEIGPMSTQGGVHTFTRRINYGTFAVTDEVTLIGTREARVHIPASKDYPESMMVIQVLEPEPGALALRFMYGQQSEGDDPLLAQRQAAYSNTDMSLAQWILAEHSRGHLQAN